MDDLCAGWLDKLHAEYEEQFNIRFKRCDENPANLDEINLEMRELNK